MSALLNNLSLIHNHDPICIPYGLKPVCYHYDGFLLRKILSRLCQLPFVLRINIRKPATLRELDFSNHNFLVNMRFLLRYGYFILPYIEMASSMVSSPLPTLNAALRIWVVSGSRIPRTSGENVRSAGTCAKGA